MEHKSLCSACLCIGRELTVFKNAELNYIYRLLLNEIPNLQYDELWLCFECCGRFRSFKNFQKRIANNYYDLVKCMRQGTTICHITKSPQLKVHLLTSTSYPDECDNNDTDIKSESDVDIKAEPINYDDCYTEPETFTNQLKVINKATALDHVARKHMKKSPKRSKKTNEVDFLTEKETVADKLKQTKRSKKSNSTQIGNLSYTETLGKLKESKPTKKNKKANNTNDNECILDSDYERLKVNKKPNLIDNLQLNICNDDENTDNITKTDEIIIAGDISIQNVITNDLSAINDCKKVDYSSDEGIDNDDTSYEETKLIGKIKKNQKKQNIKKKSSKMKSNNENTNSIDKSIEIDVKLSVASCNICNCSFINEEELDKHRVDVHNADIGDSQTNAPIICNICGEVSSNESKHQSHLSRTHYARPQCAQCGKMFSSMKTYRYHLNVIHKGQNRFPCPQCGKVYQWKSNLWRHLKNHKARESGELYCLECDKRFSSVATYQQHLRISRRHCNESDYTFTCSDCGKKFVTKTRLRDHVDWEHLKKINHRCDVCNKPFKSKTSLYVHVQNVHKSKEEKDNLCHVCGKSYQNIAKLKYHIIAMHTSATPYSCDKCPAAFSWYSSLYRHTKEVHDKVKLKNSKKARRNDNMSNVAIITPQV